MNNGIKAKIFGNTGVGCFTGGISVGPYDYAELFETADGGVIEYGYFVTLSGDKVRKATTDDNYILGVTSVSLGIEPHQPRL